jgi:23S rRNA (pseudouridine1915-N3)-methyltransferase
MVAAIGRLKDGAERAVFEKYCERFAALGKRLSFQPVIWQELPESRAGSASTRVTEEGVTLLKIARGASVIVALDVRGKTVSSEDFARLLAKVRDDGAKATAIILGGADGLSQETLEAAQYRISLGAITLPHGLARIVLAEQLYRAATILTGHPYHRV